MIPAVFISVKQIRTSEPELGYRLVLNFLCSLCNGFTDQIANVDTIGNEAIICFMMDVNNERLSSGLSVFGAQNSHNILKWCRPNHHPLLVTAFFKGQNPNVLVRDQQVHWKFGASLLLFNEPIHSKLLNGDHLLTLPHAVVVYEILQFWHRDILGESRFLRRLSTYLFFLHPRNINF